MAHAVCGLLHSRSRTPPTDPPAHSHACAATKARIRPQPRAQTARTISLGCRPQRTPAVCYHVLMC
eukprot:3157427-Prymnesium_polylepis.2